MRILRLGRSQERSGRLVALFGVGLIGSSIQRALSASGEAVLEDLPLGWDLAGAEGQAGLARVSERLAAHAREDPAELEVVWSAGRAGFAATPAETEAELTSYEAGLDWAAALGDRLGRQPRFHLLSSAGGLFEGAGLVRGDTPPAPRRPYGELKLRQEEGLRAREPLLARIYRPTTVYGFLHPGHRQGLIQVLLQRALRHQVTSIYGGLATLRDFVFSEDVGAFVAAQVHGARGPAEPSLLGSGRPASIYEVQRLVETILGRRIYVANSLTQRNARDLTYDPRAFPRGWAPRPLETGVRQVYQRWTGANAPWGA